MALTCHLMMEELLVTLFVKHSKKTYNHVGQGNQSESFCYIESY